MIIDKRTEFADAAALNTGAAGSYRIGNVIDLEKTGLDLGTGEPLYLVISVDSAASSGGSATAAFTLASDAQAAIATDGTATVHVKTDAIPVASLTAGKQITMVALPAGTYERYLGILQTTGTAAFTGGAIDAFLTPDPSGWKAYPDAI